MKGNISSRPGLLWFSDGVVSSKEDEVNRKLVLFSGNDYMCLSSHPAVREAAVKVCQFCVYDSSAHSFFGSALSCFLDNYFVLGRQLRSTAWGREAPR